MVYSDQGSKDDRPNQETDNGTRADGPAATDPRHPDVSDSLYFFPDQAVSEARVRWILEHGSRDERAWVASHLLRFAQWDDIWEYVTRDEVRDLFPDLELPENLRAAWGRMLKVEATPVG